MEEESRNKVSSSSPCLELFQYLFPFLKISDYPWGPPRPTYIKGLYTHPEYVANTPQVHASTPASPFRSTWVATSNLILVVYSFINFSSHDKIGSLFVLFMALCIIKSERSQMYMEINKSCIKKNLRAPVI